MDSGKRGVGPVLIGLLLGSTALSIALLGWWLPYQARERIASNERRASAALKELATANADFRANDRDGNRVNDFWVADVSGLYLHGRLIHSSLAAADARPLGPGPRAPIPHAGYYFIALELNPDYSTGKTLPYATDTDGSGRKVHNNSEFGFCAYPALYGITGRHTFIINEGNTIFKFDMGGAPMIRWPMDEFLQTDYEKID